MSGGGAIAHVDAAGRVTRLRAESDATDIADAEQNVDTRLVVLRVVR
jgi:hypothetical protein